MHVEVHRHFSYNVMCCINVYTSLHVRWVSMMIAWPGLAGKCSWIAEIADHLWAFQKLRFKANFRLCSLWKLVFKSCRIISLNLYMFEQNTWAKLFNHECRNLHSKREITKKSWKFKINTKTVVFYRNLFYLLKQTLDLKYFNIQIGQACIQEYLHPRNYERKTQNLKY